MLKVATDNIIPLTEARFKLAQIVQKVKKTEDFLVLTRLGRPYAALVDVDFLGELIRYKKIGSLLEEARRAFSNYLVKKGYSEEKIASLTEKQVEKILFGKDKI